MTKNSRTLAERLGKTSLRYDRPTVLSLQLRQTMLRRLTRTELWNRLQIVRTLEPVVNEAYRISEEKILREAIDDDPHGQPWHVSFHASQFPGDDPMACPRQSLYRMMNFPQAEPTSRMLRQTAAQGKAIESDLVRAWDMSGMLLSSPDPDNQTGFELPDAWLTCSVDAVILPPDSNRPLPVEVKNRSAEVLEKMQTGQGPYPEHVSQLKVQIAFVRLYQESGLWKSDLDLVTHGMVYYVSRNHPLQTAEFRVDYDPVFFQAGVEKLKQWRSYFEEDFLPELNPGKRSTIFGHPHGWRWSYPPCQFCSFKKTCQLDFREGVTQLSDSAGVARAKLIRPDYDAESSRLHVRARWQKRKDDRNTHSQEQPQTT